MRQGLMLKVSGIAATMLLVAACGTEDTKPAAETSGSGNQTQVAEQPKPATAPQPTGPAAGSQEHFVLNVADRVFFDFDSSALSADSRATLGRQAAYLKQFPGKTIIVAGHCDERGTREYNLALGEQRANAVKQYLVSLGVDGGRVSTISYGKERPVALGHNEAAWSQNRRGVTTISN